VDESSIKALIDDLEFSMLLLMGVEDARMTSLKREREERGGR